jgi:broad specificity phosphatase PhoE
MIRLSLVAPAPTLAQREYRFPAVDDQIQPLDAGLVARVRALLHSHDTAFCGPERRARETAAALDLRITALPCAELRAWSAGEWSGHPHDDIAVRQPEVFHAWQSDPYAAPPGGESLHDLLERTAAWAGSVAQTHLTPAHLTPAHLTPAHLTPAHLTPAHLTPAHLTPAQRQALTQPPRVGPTPPLPGDNVPPPPRRLVVVADSAVLQALIVYILAAPPATFWRFDLPPLSLSIVQYAQGHWRLRHLVIDPTDPLH